jgi:hypothetical protein
MVSARTRIVLCFTIVILIGAPALLIGIKGWWFYPRIREFKAAAAIILALIAILSIALYFLCRAGRGTSIFALGFTVVWVLLLLPETQYYLDTRGATADSIVEPFYRQYETIGYVMALFPIPFVLSRLWLRRRQTI